MNDPPAGKPARGRPSLRVVPDLDASDRLRVHLGERLRLLRIQNGLTQEKAAGEAGITRNWLAELEKARFPNPTLNTLLRLMQVYRLGSVEELLGPTPSARLAAAWEEAEWDTSRKENSP
jgi:transcriptional regulator with XRE-family HTH domain